MQNSALSQPGLREATIWRLQRVSVADPQNCRNRFIPRSALFDILDQRCVQQLLTPPGDQPAEVEAQKRNSWRVCSQPGACHCRQKQCTGLRIVFATLMFIGKEHSILSILSFPGENICDVDLPFRQTSPRSCSADDDAGRTRLRTALQTSNSPSIDDADRDLFESLQWQFLTPFIHRWERTGVSPVRFPYEISLPWIEVLEDRKPVEGAHAHVRKLQIYPEYHNLVSFLLYCAWPY